MNRVRVEAGVKALTRKAFQPRRDTTLSDAQCRR